MTQGNPNPSPDTRFKPGVPNGGGRPKKLIRRIEEVLHSKGIDPIEEILKLIGDPQMASSTKLKTWIELLPYVYARAKEDQSPVDKVRDDLAALTHDQLVARLEQDLKTLKSA